MLGLALCLPSIKQIVKAGGPPAGGALNPNNVVSLLHFDASPFTDVLGNTITSQGTPLTLNTTTKKFGAGAASGTVDGYLSTTAGLHSTRLADFCSEIWVYPTSFAARQTLAGSYNAADSGWNFGLDATTGYVRGYVEGSGSGPITFISTAAPTLNTWNHVALTRYGSVMTLWLNGVAVKTQAFVGDIDTSATAAALAGESGRPVIGHVDEYRMTIGEPVYTTAFTPAAAAFDQTAARVTVVGTPTAAETAATTTVSINYPAGIAANDIIVIWALSRDIAPASISLPGFTLVDSQLCQGTGVANQWLSVFTKVATGTESGAVSNTFTGNGSGRIGLHVGAYRHSNGVAPTVRATFKTFQNDITTGDLPWAVTTATADALIALVGTCTVAGGAPATKTVVSSGGPVCVKEPDDGANYRLTVARAYLGVPSAMNGKFTCASVANTWATITIYLG